MYKPIFDPAIAEWVGERLPVPVEFGQCAGVGIECDGELIAGVVYSGLLIGPNGPHTLEMTIASSDPKWATRKTLRLFFGFAFENLDVNRVVAFTTKKNKPARTLLERLGFVYEGKLREAYPNGADALVYGMLRRECRWL